MLKLHSIETEAAACRKAFEGASFDTWAHCLHHDGHIELLTEPPEGRVAYILAEKPHKEQAIRLRHLRPIVPRKTWPDELCKAWTKLEKAGAEWKKAWAERKKAWAEVEKAWAEWEKIYVNSGAHDRDFPDCRWNGKTILSRFEPLR